MRCRLRDVFSGLRFVYVLGLLVYLYHAADAGRRIMFEIVSDRLIPANAIADERLRRLLEYWIALRGSRILPSWSEAILSELGEHLDRLHVLAYEGPGRFRFLRHGGGVTNPDVRDMTGLTTQDYRDKRFGGLVTRHYQECSDRRVPIYRHVVARLSGEPYEFYRLILPLSDDGLRVNILLASPGRITVPPSLPLPGEARGSSGS